LVGVTGVRIAEMMLKVSQPRVISNRLCINSS